MQKGLVFSEQARKEFEEVKDWCPKCISEFFKPRFKEAMTELKEKGLEIPGKFKEIVKKAEKAAEN